MIRVTHSEFSRIRYLVDPAQQDKLHIPLGVAVEVVVSGQWLVGICVRSALSNDEIAVLDGIGRDLLRNPFEFVKREVQEILPGTQKPGDVLAALASTNVWSLNVTPAETWGLSLRNGPVEAQLKEQMSALWSEVVRDLLKVPAPRQARRAVSRRARRSQKPPSIVPAGRFFTQENCWRVPSVLAAA